MLLLIMLESAGEIIRPIKEMTHTAVGKGEVVIAVKTAEIPEVNAKHRAEAAVLMRGKPEISKVVW